MNKRLIKTFFACLLCGSMAQAQSTDTYVPTIPDRIPPAPTSRVFQKFAEYPISHATGTIDVQVPLHTLEVGGLSLPFTLKYHSSGVRVQDPVGAVGRNWAFFPGFKISRTIMGKPDEVYPVTDIGSNPTIENELCIAPPYDDVGDNCDCWNEMSGHNAFPRIDGQYDLFRIDMAGLSCSFILQHVNGTDVVKQITESPLKITPLLDDNTNFIRYRLYGFEVLDDQGNKYVFGESEPVHDISRTLGYIEKNSTNLTFCGWMLRKVELADGNTIDFTYHEIYESVPLYNNTIMVLDNGEQKGVAGCYFDDMVNHETGSDSPFWRYLGTFGYQIKYGNEHPHAYANRSLMPDSITFPHGRMVFSYTDEKLTQMVLEGTDGKSVKTALLAYDSSATNTLLKSVSISGEGDYQFTYKNEGALSQKGFDWWGFYNGQATHNSNLPTLAMSVYATRNGIGTNESISIGDNANRTPNATYMDTHSLIKVTSPTRGTLTINYEPHSFTHSGTTRTGGGLRVKSTLLYDPVSGKTTTKTYTYGDAHYLGNSYPEAKTLVSNRYMCSHDAGYCTFRIRTYSVFPHHPHMRGGSNCVWYGNITETTDDWKKEYKYSMIPDEYTNYYTDATPSDTNEPECLLSQMNSLLFAGPSLLAEDSYKKENGAYVKVQSVRHTYDTYKYNIKGLIAFPWLKIVDGYSHCQFLETLSACDNHNYISAYGSPIKMYNYNIAAGCVRPGSTRRVDYHETDSIVETTTMFYDSERKYNLASRSIQKSDGTEETELFYYSNNTIPDEATLTTEQQSAIDALTTNNRLTTVVQSVSKKGAVQQRSVLNGYDSSSRLQSAYYSKGASRPEERLRYLKYDKYRNPIHLEKDKGENVVYIWGYNGERLVGEIRGATCETVEQALGCSLDSLSSAASPNMTLIDGLRSKLTGATVITYTYDPLLGPITQKDATGNITHYEYDSSGRLSKVKDNDGYATEQYQYNFRP